jgi:hypothetical protein
MLNEIRTGAGSSDILTNWPGECDMHHTFIDLFFSPAFCHPRPAQRQTLDSSGYPLLIDTAL